MAGGGGSCKVPFRSEGPNLRDLLSGSSRGSGKGLSMGSIREVGGLKSSNFIEL